MQFLVLNHMSLGRFSFGSEIRTTLLYIMVKVNWEVHSSLQTPKDNKRKQASPPQQTHTLPSGRAAQSLIPGWEARIKQDIPWPFISSKKYLF